MAESTLYVVPKTPIIREKPFLYIDKSGSYCVMVQDLNKDSTIGMSWAAGPVTGTSVPLDLFYIARGGTDNVNKNANGLIVNGSNITMYGLFVEHMQEYQTIWNGNGGRTYMYQSEFPYDMPNQTAWKNGTGNGWASYKVGTAVTSHECWAGGGYAAIHTSGIVVDNAFEVPVNVPGIKMRNLLTVGLSSNVGTVTHIINGVGASALPGNGSSNIARLAAYP
jgi:hypothetical protein